MPSYAETEVKLHYPDLAGMQARLEAAGAALIVPRVFERNVRYENAEKTLSPRGIVLRLRQDDRTRLTYKEGGTLQDGVISRFEAEVEVSDFDAMQTILGKLGYAPYLIYEKYRTTYTLDGAEVVLDEMPYGNFIEIEGDKDTIERVITRLGLAGARRYTQSYIVLFQIVRERLGLTCHDLTFANFEGLSVPESAFA